MSKIAKRVPVKKSMPSVVESKPVRSGVRASKMAVGVEKSTCPVHGVALDYAPHKLVWACPLSECKYTEVPEQSVLQAVVDGPAYLTVVTDRDGDATVFIAAGSVFINVSSMIGPSQKEVNEWAEKNESSARLDFLVVKGVV